MTEDKKKGKTWPSFIISLLFLVVILILVTLDQVSKFLAALYLKGTDGIVLIPGLLKLQYLENRGMAFGMLQGKQMIFIIFCLIFLGIIFFIFYRIPKNRYYLPLIVTGAFLAGGAAGNFIDRLVYGYVIDFIYLVFIDFPIFNIADIYVVSGGIALAAVILFRYKDQDFAFLGSGPKRKG